MSLTLASKLLAADIAAFEGNPLPLVAVLGKAVTTPGEKITSVISEFFILFPKFSHSLNNFVDLRQIIIRS